MTSLLLAILFLLSSHVQSLRRLESGGNSDYLTAECYDNEGTIDCENCKKYKEKRKQLDLMDQCSRANRGKVICNQKSAIFGCESSPISRNVR